MTRQLFTPKTYQNDIDNFAVEQPRSAIWAGMGMGKTASIMTALDKLWLVGEETKPALVLAPLRVANSTWPDEAAKWQHLSGIHVQPITGSFAERIAALRKLKSSYTNIFTINYENLPWLIDVLDGEWPFGTVVADESTKLKSFRLRQGGRRARAIGSVAHNKTRRWINLTGTPAPNGLADLWGQTWFLDQGERLGRTYTSFEDRWFGYKRKVDAVTGRQDVERIVFPHAQAEITSKLRGICLSVNPADHLDLLVPVENNIFIDLPPKARALYKDMERDMFMQIEEFGVEAVNAGVRTNKCLQLCNGAVYVDQETKEWREVHDLKIHALEDVFEEAAGMPVLVAYNFRTDVERLRRAFPRGRVLDTDPQTIRDWNAGRIPYMFAHPASAGHGLNLQDGGNILAFFGLNWNLEEHLQIIERIGPVRQLQSGHNRPLFLHRIVARDTVEEWGCMERLAKKRSVQELLLEAMKRRGLA